MTASISASATKPALLAAAAPAPSFLGILRGEALKIARMRLVWLMTLLFAGVICAPYLFYLATPGVKEGIQTQPAEIVFALMGRALVVVRVFGGIYILLLTALLIGIEYQSGTIRVLLARGVGRLHLLGAKLLVLAGVALALIVGGALLNALLVCATLLALVHNLGLLSAITGTWWNQTWIYALTVAISMGVSILLAAAATVLGRSLAFGLGIAIAWFPVDNLSTILLLLANRFTNNDAWLKVSAYLLGPNLNAMPTVLVPARVVTIHGAKGIQTISQPAATIGFPPFVTVDGTHTLVVTLIYALIFATIAAVIMWRRDVLE